MKFCFYFYKVFNCFFSYSQVPLIFLIGKMFLYISIYLTPLFFAERNGYTDIVDILKKKGGIKY